MNSLLKHFVFFSFLTLLSLGLSNTSFAERKAPYQVEKSAYFKKPGGSWSSAKPAWYEKAGDGLKKILLGWKDLLPN